MSDSSPKYVERTVSRSSSGLGTVLCRRLNEDLGVYKGLRLSRAARGVAAFHARELLAEWRLSAYGRRSWGSVFEREGGVSVTMYFRVRNF